MGQSQLADEVDISHFFTPNSLIQSIGNEGPKMRQKAHKEDVKAQVAKTKNSQLTHNHKTKDSIYSKTSLASLLLPSEVD